MNFKEYSQRFECQRLFETEQSKTFLVEGDKKEKRICKKFPDPIQRSREELAHRYILQHNLLDAPHLIRVGEDFLEMEFIEKLREPETKEIISKVSPLYLKTIYKTPFDIFPQIDLSKHKLIYRISYLGEEFLKREVEEGGILERAKIFTERSYLAPSQRCLVHGDLKSLHSIPSEKNFKFIDFGLTCISSHWYDLAFLYMEKKDKKNTLEYLSHLTYEFIDKKMGLSFDKTKRFLQSGIFYRCLYNLGYSLRHKPIKTIERVKKELNEIIESQ